MTTLTDVLRRYSTPAALAGSEALDRAALAASLDGILRRYRLIMWLALAMAVALFMAEFAVGALHLDTPKYLAGVGAAMGVTAGGVVGVVRGIAKDMAQTSLIIALTRDLDREILKPIIDALAKRI